MAVAAVTLDIAAQRLYESRNLTWAPTWDQLGETTRDVWRERVALAWVVACVLRVL